MSGFRAKAVVFPEIFAQDTGSHHSGGGHLIVLRAPPQANARFGATSPMKPAFEANSDQPSSHYDLLSELETTGAAEPDSTY